MNKIFRIKWNLNSNSFVVCHEKNKSRLSNSSSASPKGAESLIIFITQQFKFKKFIFLSSVISLFTPLYLFANPATTELPKGADIVIGNVTINTNQNNQSPVMNVNQASQRAVVNWNSFNVGSDATINFNQPNVSASILNRISNQSPSQIFGKINANGEVILMNPAGIYFGKTSSLNVGAITATTHNISNDDFMKGLMTFDRNGSSGSIINDGSITANFDSYIALLAPEVRNSGLLIAKMGTVVMASGEKITLNFDSDHHLGSITSDPSIIKSLIENNYAVEVEGGRIILSANAINTIAGSLINQNGLLNAGSNATQLVKQGGQILLLADTINLNNGSRTLANGLFGGGEILIGGSWQNSNPTFIQALKTSVADAALIQANATDKGNGGTIVIWSDITNKNSLTNVQGTLEAKGGINGGDGGKIETSGHQVYLDGIKISASAYQGSSGTWLIDPYDVVIGTSASGTAYSDNFVPGASSYILASSINTSLNAGTNVSISTGSNAANTITLNTAISKTSGGNATLSLTGGTININQTISGSSSSGSLGITLDAQTINSNYLMTINGGALDITTVNASTLNAVAGSGQFNLHGYGITLNDSRNGTFTGTTTIDSGATLQLNSGKLDGNITNNGTLYFYDPFYINYSGVISGSGVLKQNYGNLYLTGANTYTGTTSIGPNNGGANLYLGYGGTTGSLASESNINIGSGSTLHFNRTNAMTVANTISGAGGINLIKQSGTDWNTDKSGIVTLTGNNTYTGSTWLNEYTQLQLGAGGTTGSLSDSSVIYMHYGTNLISNRSDNVTIGNYLYSYRSNGPDWNDSKAGNDFIQNGTGTVTLSNNSNNFNGYLRANNGGLTITGSAGSTSNYLANNGQAVVFNTTNATSALQQINNISGTGTFRVTGTGTLTLGDSRNGTFTGTTTIDSGATLQLNSGKLDGNITNNGTLYFYDPFYINYSGVISGSGVLKQNYGNLYLTGANTYTGTTSIGPNNGGANLYLGYGGTTGSLASESNINIGSGSTLHFNRTNAMTVANTISGAGGINLIKQSGTDWNTDKSGIVTLTGNNTYTGSTWLNEYTQLQLGAGGTTGSLSDSSVIYMHYGTNLISNRSDNVTIGNYLYSYRSNGPDWNDSKAGNDFIQNGTGTVTLSNNSNNFNGMTRINAGSITFNNTGSFGNSSNQISFSGGAIKYVEGNKTDYSNKFSTAANQQYSVDVNGQAITWATALNSSGGSLTVTDSAGSGSLSLTANNTYSGATNINGGNLTFSGSGAATSSTALNIGNSASYTLSNTSAFSNTGSMALSVASGGNLTLSANRTFGSISGAGNIALGSNTLTTGSNNNSTTYSGVMSGTGALSKTGTGTLTLSGSNTYSGGTTISNGMIKLGSAAALGTSTATVSSGATLDLNGQTAVANNLSLNGTGISSLGALYNSSTSAASTSGNITLTGNTSFKSLGNITFNGNIQSSNNGSLTIDATGKTVTLNGLVGADPTTLTGTSSLNPSSVTITGDTINLNNDITGGTQTFNGAINVGDNGTNGTTRTVLAVGTSPSTTFNGTINDTVANTHTLNTKSVTTSINNTPTITFNGNVGQVKALAGMETTAMYQPSSSGTVYGALPATIDTSSNYSGTINVNGAFKTTGDQTFTGKTLEFATNQPASISGNINIYGYSATSGGVNTSTINIPGFKVTSGTQTIKGLSADQLLTVAKTIDKTIDPNFVATVSGSGGSAGTNNGGRVKFDAGLGSKIIKDIAIPKSILSSPIQSGGSLKPSINIGEVYIDGLSNNIGAPVITNNFSQPGAGNAFIRQPTDE